MVEIRDPDTFMRPIYAGNALATVRAKAAGPRVLSVRPTAFPPAAAAGGAAVVEPVGAEELAAAQAAGARSEWVREEVAQSERPELAQAKVVVSGGRALKSAENFRLLEQLADTLGGAVGASRAAVDAGYVPNDLQVQGGLPGLDGLGAGPWSCGWGCGGSGGPWPGVGVRRAPPQPLITCCCCVC